MKNLIALILGTLAALAAALDPLKGVKRRLGELETDLACAQRRIYELERLDASSKRRIDYLVTELQALRADVRENSPVTIYRQQNRRANIG